MSTGRLWESSCERSGCKRSWCGEDVARVVVEVFRLLGANPLKDAAGKRKLELPTFTVSI
jgi:hypothetical protein